MRSPDWNRSAGSKLSWDERAECKNHVLSERLKSSRLVQTSDEPKHAIEVSSRVSIRANAFLPPIGYADCEPASGIRQLTYDGNKCGVNNWFANTFGTSSASCVH
jgi:hypothetical protein